MSKKSVTVSIRKFGIVVLVSNRIEYWSNYSIRFEISNICTTLVSVSIIVLVMIACLCCQYSLCVCPPLCLLLSFIFHFYARQHICYSAYMSRQFRLSVCLSVHPSVTRVLCAKTAERIIEILSPSDRPNTLVFRHQRSLRKSDGFTPNGGAKYKGG